MGALGAIVVRLLSKYLYQIAIVLAILAAYFAWAHHIAAVQEEKDKAAVAVRDAETAKKSAELLAGEKAKVEKANNETIARLKNAVDIYAEHSSNLSADVTNLVERMRSANSKRSSCGKDSVPRADIDNLQRESGDNGGDYDIARAAIKLANLCELQINRLPVVDK